MIDFTSLYRLSPSFFNKSSWFTSKTCQNSPENSFSKVTRQLKHSKIKQSSVAYKKNKAIAKGSIKDLYLNVLFEHYQLKNLEALYILKDLKIEEKLNQTAVQIQKIIKGWLIRRKFDGAIIEIHRRTTFSLINDMEAHVKSLLYIGKVVKTAIIYIQQAVKSRKKLSIEQAFVASFRKSVNDFKEKLKVLTGRFKIIENYNNLRDRKLADIRRRLCLINIRKVILKFKQALKKERKKRQKRVPPSQEEALSKTPGAIFIQLRKRAKGFTIQETNSDSSESSAPDLYKLISKQLLKKYKPRTAVSGIPVLIERKRNSQIWVETTDTEGQAQVTVPRQSNGSSREMLSSATVTRKNSINGKTPGHGKYRNSISYTLTTHFNNKIES